MAEVSAVSLRSGFLRHISLSASVSRKGCGTGGKEAQLANEDLFQTISGSRKQLIGEQLSDFWFHI